MSRRKENKGLADRFFIELKHVFTILFMVSFIGVFLLLWTIDRLIELGLAIKNTPNYVINPSFITTQTLIGVFAFFLLLLLSGTFLLLLSRYRLAVEQYRLLLEKISNKQHPPALTNSSFWAELDATIIEEKNVQHQLQEGFLQAGTSVAHDLRTPIHQICSLVDMGLLSEDPEDLDRILARLKTSAKDLSKTFDVILSIARLEADAKIRCPMTVDVAALCEELAQYYEIAATSFDMRVSLTVLSRPVLQTDRAMLGQVISNVMENSLRYCPAGTLIDIQLRSASDYVNLQIKDNGPGVDPRQINFVFERFVRGSSSLLVDGNGLGLNLVRAVITAMGGRCRARNLQPRGLLIEIDIPLNNQLKLAPF